jgi:hypothetical protein
VTSQVIKKDLVFLVILEHLPQIAWLLPVFLFDVGRVCLDLTNPFAVSDVGGTTLDLAKG